MSPAHDNAAILADPNAFLAAHARARQQFMRYEGVLGVGYGQKQTGNTYRDDIAIVVFVREKKAADRVPPAERIPPTFEGYPTDVKIVLEAHPQVGCDNETQYDEIKGGIQICPTGQVQGTPAQYVYETGTLGAIVKKRSDSGRENVYLLTNKHVIFSNGVSEAGGYVYHPFPSIPSGFESKPSKALGPIQHQSLFGNEPVRVPDPANAGQFITIDMFLDAAIARIDLDSTCCGSTCTQDSTKYAEKVVDLQVQHPNTTVTVDTIADVRDVSHGPNSVSIINKKVFKVGRTTGRTVGIVRHIDRPVQVPAIPHLGTAAFRAEHTIDIDFDPASSANGVNCKGNAWFTDKGDSGSLVVDEQGRAIGLHSLGPPPGSPQATSSNACHIVPILDRLGIAIACASGTSHGSSRATDGSGAMPTAPTPAQTELPAGAIVFTALTDDDVSHMRGLLAAFRATPRGPELHQVFADVRREVGYLVRNCRPVTVAWHRQKGPAFLAHVLNHLAGHTDGVPHDVQGVTRRALLVRMGEVLSAHGSTPLRDAIARYGDGLLAILGNEECDSAADCLALMQERELA